MNAKPAAGDTVYYHGSDTELHGRRFVVAASYPAGLKVRYDLAEPGDPARTPVLTGARTESLTVIADTGAQAYIRQAFGPAGLAAR